ncbi:YchJ family metal-binding protein [Sulfurospirillum sp. MES]|uniref:YchJ family protein n=1 Tax=Sulfurospirillum sp. MES TaxID=1565314 RepID=UPI0005429D3B|nr:YchJ family metal-binding protein [Sulfurospirillum sp. MES]KHG34974.1 MAG: zinc chelation protein SecC [Sulfurospirillum sp. MES]
MKKADLCPCGSQKPYEACCERYHKAINAPTCEALMRSRFSAFVFGLADYLVQTTHPHSRDKHLKEEIIATCKRIAWMNVEVLSVWQGGVNDKVGKVSFRATYVHEGKEGLHVEHSRFKRYGKTWMYVDGEVD